ncbi:MAG TPA: indolepyruvate ferredoxin oxidoreductase subunit alpha [Candidatus Nitrosocosmicus sp.]|jgi:indolepyruvate ferredoxin oxidoreductase alpha subunit|nr:indolepyruvate ferredoxin oxidoreductase subunit alpha [Candidatus Nitrosocosmicus sp.]
MERSFAAEVKQLALGRGQVLRGEGILAITKALLQSGVSYVGGYPGAPVSHLLDVMADANESLLKPMGVYFDASANEAAAAALLGASINYPMRGAVTWKSVVGTNVASDALSNLASAGVIGGALVVVGEDYGAGASVIQERTHAFALKSSLLLFDPRPSLQNLAATVGEAFAMSEASNLPAVISLRIRTAHMRGAMVCEDNVRPAIGVRDPLQAHSFDYGRLSHPPSTYAQEVQKFERRLPAAREYIRARGLNQIVPGDREDIGIILQGGLTPTVLRALALLGQADAHGRSRIPLLVLNVIHPLVPEEVLGFVEGKARVLVIEEGMPNFIEQELKALAYERRLDVRIHGKDTVAAHGEYVPEVVLGGVARFLGGEAEARRAALAAHAGRGREILRAPLPKRPPAFCTGCPERPVFSALKIAQRELGETHVAADIGCHAFATLPPFNMGNTILGYGMGLASAGAVAPAFGKRVVSILGDGGFWHSGLTAGVAGAVFNQQDSVLVILENGYTSATGQQANPSTGTNPRGQTVRMSIADTIRSLGVRWMRVVNPYRLESTLRTIREAMTTTAGGLKVVIAKAECQLERQRRVKPQIAARLKAGGRVDSARFGVDPDVCTGDKSCMRLNGCPSLTLGDSGDPLRTDPVARVDQSCVGCGLCGEVAHAAVLCPSFYEAVVVRNARVWERGLAAVRARVIGWLQAA